MPHDEDPGTHEEPEEKNQADYLSPMPEIAIEEPKVESSADVPFVEDSTNDSGPVHRDQDKGSAEPKVEAEEARIDTAIELECRPYQEEIKTLKEDSRRRQTEDTRFRFPHPIWSSYIHVP